ncbi:uncharacterized protein LOC129758795 isoform X2 [Uranotaenia lowii]|nr:uncharacterized protein LOC129758795 isoform X2 [Uranotaenia lowii]
MSSSNKSKSGSTGLRILWIPGRKKHNRKGVYNPTKSSLPQHNAHLQRKNQSWTLGGPINHSKIINANFYFRDLHDNLDVGMATASGAMSLAAMAANKTVVVPASPDGSPVKNPSGVAAEQQQQQQPIADGEGGAASCSNENVEVFEFVVLNDLNGDNCKKDIPSNNQFETLELIDACDKDRNFSNTESSSSLLSSNNDSRSAEYMHNSATLAIGEARRRRRRNSYNNSKKNSSENLDSIDHINDPDDDLEAGKTNSSMDEPRLDTFRQSKHKTKKKNRPSSRQARDVIDGADDEGRDKKGKDDALVTCLYYSFVCWDCSIS